MSADGSSAPIPEAIVQDAGSQRLPPPAIDQPGKMATARVHPAEAQWTLTGK